MRGTELLLYKIIVCFVAGVGAGLGTGFAGISAATAITPILVTFLDMPAYEAVGIALASDVLASAISAFTYKRNGNLLVRQSLVLMLTVLVFTMVGSFVSSFVKNDTMGGFSMIMTLALGAKFLIRPVMTTRENLLEQSKKERTIKSLILGTLIGFTCGFIGAGGGMMMLIVLTAVLGYDLKNAVGTSVFVMTFTALTGAVSHFVIEGIPDITCLAVCVISTLVWARIAAVIANKAKAKTLNRATGIILIVISITILLVELLKSLT